MAGNQYQPDPRQQEFIKNYIDPNSETFSNAKQSALRAGYSKEYSDTITAQDLNWLSDILGEETELVLKAMDNLKALLDSEDERIKSDLTKFTLERLNKKKFSNRTEMTGADGGDLKISVVNYGDNNPVQIPTEDISDTTPESD